MFKISPSKPNLKKIGLDYNDEKNKIRPFDIILFRGSDFVSSTIRYLSFKAMSSDIPLEQRNEARQFSHIGMIVTREILDIPQLEPNKLYIWESTISGKLGENVKNVDGKSMLGVQIRDFDELIKAYDNSSKTKIAYSKVVNNPLDEMNKEEIRKNMKELYKQNNGKLYEANVFTMFAGLFPRLRKFRIPSPFRYESQFLFCSELLTIIYKKMNIIKEKNIKPENVVPSDFVVDNEYSFIKEKYFTNYKIITVFPETS